MSPEKIHAGLLVLILLASVALAWQVRAQLRFECWAHVELARLARAGACTQKAHERLCRTVEALDLRVPKRRSAPAPGWGTLLNDAETRVAGGAETFPAIDLSALAASRRQ